MMSFLSMTGVRPLVAEELLRESIAVARSYDGAVTAVQAKDTIKTAENGVVTGTPDRNSLWQAQTPQTFRYGVILSAHLAAESDHYLGTDDSSLVERIGGRVRIIQGDYHNIKLTTPEDLILAEAFLASARKTRTHYD